MKPFLKEKPFAESPHDKLVKQLTSVNEQLEQFAYVASHDLREPLRTIVCFTELLTKEYGDKLDETARKYMEINRQAAKKMEMMVANLLEYGRLGERAGRLVQTNCNDALQRALDALSESIKATRADIRYGTLPTVDADPLHLSRVFQNLIGNALKYQRSGKPPLVRVAVDEKLDHWQFSVADNGIGIDAAYLDLIFAPFKRLHNDAEYAGTGIGLAICRRIIENFGGSIWAESKPDHGSVFFFTLPKQK
ncbi:MAG: ATP-binding protein [Bdellovibrionales bacterium]